jgi:putative aldouronate transport system permease protein
MLSQWELYLFVLPVIIYLAIFSYGPMYGVIIAFKDFKPYKGYLGSDWVGLKHFIRLFGLRKFPIVVGNTVVLSVYSLLAGFPLPILLALALNSCSGHRFKRTVQTITYAPYFISTVVLVGMLMQIFHPLTGVYGVIAKLLTGSVPPDLFAKPQVFPHLYVWSGVWQTFGYSSIIYIAALTNVSAELHEAAEVDGAGRFKRVLHIDFPALLPTIIIMLILRTGSILSIGFEKAFLMQNTLNLSQSEIISTFVYKKGLASGASNDYSYSAAIGMFNSVVNLIMITLVNAVARKCGESSLW